MSRVMLITGAGRGIGAATARLAGRRGDAVCVNYRQNRAAAEAVVADIQREGGRAVSLQADVSQESDVLRLFAAIDSELGPISALVNNAGILERQCRLEEIGVERLTRILATNVIGAFLCAREAVRRMSTRHGGRGGTIVNVSSMAGRLGSPGEYIDYAASKGALDTMTIGLSKEVGPEGIRVNAVRPGIIDTEIHASGGEPGRVHRLGPTLPMRRFGTAEEVARAILWLTSDDSSYTTGTFLEVGGGV